MLESRSQMRSADDTSGRTHPPPSSSVITLSPTLNLEAPSPVFRISPAASRPSNSLVSAQAQRISLQHLPKLLQYVLHRWMSQHQSHRRRFRKTPGNEGEMWSLFQQLHYCCIFVHSFFDVLRVQVLKPWRTLHLTACHFTSHSTWCHWRSCCSCYICQVSGLDSMPACKTSPTAPLAMSFIATGWLPLSTQNCQGYL